MLAGQPLLPEPDIFGVIAVVGGQLSPVHLPDAPAEPVQKIPIVGNDEKRALIGAQVILQPAQGLKIQVVGGLVQDQQVGLLQQELCNGQTGLLAAAELVDGFVKAVAQKAHAGEDGVYPHRDVVPVPCQVGVLQPPVFFRHGLVSGSLRHGVGGGLQLVLQAENVGKNAAHLLQDGPALGEAAILLLIADGQVPAAGDRPLVVLQGPADDVQQGGFSRAVLPHQSNPVPVLYFGCHARKYQVAAITFTDIL